MLALSGDSLLNLRMTLFRCYRPIWYSINARAWKLSLARRFSDCPTIRDAHLLVAPDHRDFPITESMRAEWKCRKKTRVALVVAYNGYRFRGLALTHSFRDTGRY